MSSKKLAELMGLTQDIEPVRVERKPSEARTAPGRMISALTGRDEALDRAERAETEAAQLREKLATTKQQSGALEVPLADLHEVAGRKRKLTDEQYGELVDNLRNNPLVTPITVRSRAEGGFEIISGHNRVAAFRDLEREKIPAVIAETDQEQADVNAFYANLLQPDLSDYEKYLGFKMLKAKYPGMKDGEIASKAGKSKSFVSQIKCFDDLPPAALAVISEKPSIIGANTVQLLAGLVKKGRSQQVIEAVIQLANGTVDQTKAVRIASQDPTAKTQKRSEPIRYKIGKTTYCDFRRADKVLRIDFASIEEANAVEIAIKEILQQRIENLKGGG